MRVWNRLDRTIAREIRAPMMLGIVGLSLIMVLNYLFQLIQRTIERRVPLSLIVGFLLSSLPRILMFVLPMAMLVAVLVGIGRLATQSEMIALRSTGLSPYRIFRPVFFVALFWSLLGVFSSEYLQPLGRAHERELFRQLVRIQDVNREIDPGVFYDKLPGAVLYAKSAGESPQGRVFRGILLYRESPDAQTIDLILAQRGRADFDAATGRRSMLLDQGEWHRYQPARPGLYSVSKFETYTLPFPPDPTFAMASDDPKTDDPALPGPALYARYRGLEQQLLTTKDKGEKQALASRARHAGLEWHRRVALPLSALGMALVGFPIAARSRRGGRFAGLSQALMIIFVFWIALSTGWSFAEKGRVPVWVGPWMPNLVAAVWAAALWIWMPIAERGGQHRDLVTLIGSAREWIRARGRRRSERSRPREAALTTASPPRRLRRFAPGRLDVFLGVGYLKMFGAVLLALLIMIAAISFRNALDEVDPQATHFPWTPILRYVALSVPATLRFLVPVSTLFAAAISLSALARTGEITALKANGIGPVRIALTLVTVTLAIAALYGAAQETILPSAMRESQRELDRVRGKTSGPELLETGRRWLVGEPGHIWNYMDWDARRKVLLTPGLLVVDLENAHVRERIQAGQAQLTPAGWLFTNGWRRVFPANGEPESFTPLTAYTVPLAETAELFGETRSRLMLGDALADQLTFARLWKNYQQSSRTGYPSAPIVVGLNEKLVFPLLPICLLLAGIPVAVSGWQRKGSLFGFGVSLAIIFCFWVIHAAATSLGREGILNPVVAAWLATIVITTYGVVSLVRAR